MHPEDMDSWHLAAMAIYTKLMLQSARKTWANAMGLMNREDPNSRVSKPNVMGRTDRRPFPRLAAEITVRYGQAGQMSAGRGYDLSVNGLGFTGCKAFPLGATLDIEFRIDSPHSDSEWFRVRGIVLYSKPDRMGVEFVETSAESRTRILKAINHELAIRHREA